MTHMFIRRSCSEKAPSHLPELVLGASALSYFKLSAAGAEMVVI